MNRKLENMTLEELWQLFPIVLSLHKQQWVGWAREEIDSLKLLLASFRPYISHIGSTAIPRILAKPIIDILVEIPLKTNRNALKKKMEDSGYICMAMSDSSMAFNKGYTPDGYAERVFHIHFHVYGDNDEILFRDYLIAHPNVAREYESLKLSLLPEFKHNRDGYTEAKSDFVHKVVVLAKQQGLKS